MLKKSKTFSSWLINAMNYLRIILLMQTPFAMRCRKLKLYLEFLHDLHNGQISTKETHFNKMLQTAINGGLWGDFATIFWISQYLQRPIYVWCKTSARIMMKCGEEYKLTFFMHLAFGNQHFELIKTIISSNLQSEISKTKWGPNFNNNIPLQKKPVPSFYDLTLEKKQTSYNQIPSNLCILFKTKRPFEQLEPSLEKIQKKKNNVPTKNIYIWIQVMDNTLTNIKLENPLSTTQNTIIAFQGHLR
jgi:hypothetical protein